MCARLLSRCRPQWRTTLPALLLVWVMPARAAHYSGASITYECLGGNQYLVHLDLFLDCSGFQIISQSLDLQSDCGSQFTLNNLPTPVATEVSQLCPSALPNSTCNGGALPGIQHYQFDAVVTLAPCDSWTISWDICCRNTTINVAALPGIYVEATLDNLNAACNNSPVFTDQSLPYVCVNQPVDYNFGVTEPDGDSLVYSLVSGQYAAPAPTAVTYNPGYSGAVPIPGVLLDPITGQLTFTPTVVGNYVVVVLVEEFDANGQLIGTVQRDILFVVLNCTGIAPTASSITNNTGGTITGPASIEVCEGEPFCVDIVFTDVDPATVLQVISQATILLPGATFTVTGSNPAIATICWVGDPLNSPVNVLVEANDGSCPIVNTVSVAVNIISVDAGGPLPDPGADAAVNACAGGPSVDLFASLGGAPATGGAWTAPGGAPHASTFNPLTDAAGAYVYTVSNSCATADATVTVTVLAVPNAGANSSVDLCSTSVPQGLFGELGGAPQSGGTWTAPGGAPFSGTYDPLIDAPGAYVYGVSGGGACPDATATVTVNELLAPNAGADGTLDLCSTSAPTSLFAALTGAQVGGGWTDPLGAPVGAWFDPSSDAPGLYTYTIPASAPCISDASTVTVTVLAQPVAGVSGSLGICSTAAAQALLPVLGGTAQAGGSWIAPGGGTFAGTYDPAVNASGAYVYTVIGAAPCVNATAAVTVTEITIADAGSSGAVALCSTDGPLALFTALGGSPQAGGSWTAPGGAAFGGTYDPAADGPGVFTYTVASASPCPNTSASVIVTEALAPDAGTNGSLALCTTAAPVALFASLTGAQAGGNWTAPGGAAFSGTFDPAIDAPGLYTYTLAGTAPCVNDQSTVAVSVTAAPDAGTDGSLTLCSSDAPALLFTSLGGAQAGGSWTAPGGAAFGGTYDPAVDAAGVYTYVLPGSAPCANDQSTVTVVELVASDAGVDLATVVCDLGTPVDLFALLVGAQPGGVWTGPGGGAFSGTYDPAVNASGGYTYTLAGTAPCPSSQATVTVTGTGSPNAGADGSLTLCSTAAPADLFTALVGSQAGGVWTAPGGAAFTGTYDPTSDVPGVYTYLISAAAPCVSDQATVTVAEVIGPDAGTSAAVSVCDPGAQISLFTQLNGASPGGSWSTPGGGAFAGIYDPVVDAPGIYTYLVNGTAPCPNAQSTVTVIENAAANAGLNGSLAFCSSGPPADLSTALVGAQAGGTWVAPGGAAFSGTFDPATDVPGVYTYTVQGVAPCLNDQSTVTTTVTNAANAGVDGTLTVCDQGGAVSLVSALTGAQSGGGWTDPGGVAFSGTYDPQLDAPGVFSYTVTGTAPCPNDQATVTVSETGSPSAGTDSAVVVCSSAASTDLFALLAGAQGGGAWTGPAGTVFNGSFDPAVDAPGTYTYLISATAPCVSDQAAVTVSVEPQPLAGADVQFVVCGNYIPFPLSSVLAPGAMTTGTWTDPNGAPFIGLFDPASALEGAYAYVVQGIACASDTAIITVDVVPDPTAGLSNSIVLCATGAPVFMTDSLLGSPDSTGTWLDPNNTVVSSTFDPATWLPGTYTYIVPAPGTCLGPLPTATLTVLVSLSVDAGLDSVLSVCTSTAPLGLFNALGGTPDVGGTWTDPNGAPFFGPFVPGNTLPGAYTYTISSPGCPTDQAVVTVGVLAGPDAGQSAAVSACSSGPVMDLFASLGGTPDTTGWWTGPGGVAMSGTLDPALGPAGVFQYSLPGAGSCPGDQATVTVAIGQAGDAGSDGSSTLCSVAQPVDLFTLLGGTPDPGGSWTGPGGGAVSAIFLPATGSPGNYVYTVSPSLPCPSVSATVTMAVSQAPSAGVDAMVMFCSADAAQSLFILLGGAPQAGGLWSGPNGAVPSGTFQPGTDAPGAYVYTVDGTAPCLSDNAVVQVGVSPVADAGTPGSVTACSNGTPIDLFQALGGAPQSGGAWMGPGGVPCGPALDPSSAMGGAYVYTVSAPAPCPQASSTVDVTIIAVPEPTITSLVGEGCAPVSVVFSTDQPVAGNCLWDLGNGQTSSQCGGDTVVYDVPGNYVVTLTVDVGSGCSGTVAGQAPIAVYAAPVASFTSAPEVITTNAPLVTFQNNSLGATSFLWSFGTFAASTEQEPVIEFPSALSDSYLVCLTAAVSPTCLDTACALVTIEPGAGLFVPTAFSPDGDGINDRFFPVMQGVDRRYHRFLILDRWGHILFDTADPDAQWSGNFPNGDPVPVGVYVWKITGKDAYSGERLDRTGSVTLVR